MARRAEQRQAQEMIETRLNLLNKSLEIICSSRVEARPLAVFRWEIVPIWEQGALPLKCDGLSLMLREQVVAIPSSDYFHLICESFQYKVEANKTFTSAHQRKVDAGWHFRYELDDKGQEHSFGVSCMPRAIAAAGERRFPPYHIHVAERNGVYDDLHYPLGEPNRPLDLIFELVRLIKDEFITS